MKKPNIFICGSSGTGKSTSLRNLDPERTIVLNVEQKQLPFKSASRFKRQAMISSIEQFDKYFTGAIKNEKNDCDVVVIESFTSLCEMIMAKSRKINTGYDVFNYFNDKVWDIVQKSKQADNYVVFLGIDQTEQTDTGETWRYVKVEGQKLKGTIEKEFVIVLFTVPHLGEKNEIEYQFVTKGDLTRSAKSPMEMLPDRMTNDLAEVIKLSEEYYKGE